MKKDDESTDIILTSLPNGWSRTKEKKWTINRNPLSGEIIWLSEDGDLVFGSPAQDEVMTFEERQLPPQFETHLENETMTRFHLGVEGQNLHLVVPEEEKGEEDETGGDEGRLDEEEDASEEMEIPEEEEEGERGIVAPAPDHGGKPSNDSENYNLGEKLKLTR